jgi:hypothetical protein
MLNYMGNEAGDLEQIHVLVTKIILKKWGKKLISRSQKYTAEKTITVSTVIIMLWHLTCASGQFFVVINFNHLI